MFRQEQMYKSSPGKSPLNAREKSSLPPENLTWHRDPRTDETDGDKVGAGKRHWNGGQSSNMASYQDVTSGASLRGNGFVPRSKPRFQGHYSGFFAKTGRNGPSFAATGPVNTSPVRRFHRNPYDSGASPAARSQCFSGSVGFDCRASDPEERHNRDQFLSSRDDKVGRNQPLPPHTPQVLSDSPLLRNGERTRPLGSRNWEYPRIDRDSITRPYGIVDLYSSRKRTIVTQFDSGRDWSVGDKRSEVGRFERYGNGSRDCRADYEGSEKDTGLSHGWRRESGRHSSFTAASRNLGELRDECSLSVGFTHDSPHATTLASNQAVVHPFPSKRPRLGWGQGLAKYEKQVDYVSPFVETTNMVKDDEGDTCRTVEKGEKRGGVEHEKFIVLGWEHEYKRQHVDNHSDSRERLGENEMNTTLIREHGVREVCGQYASSCSLMGDSLRRKEKNERKPTLTQELQGLDGRPASPVEMEDYEKHIRAGRDENTGAAINDNEELKLHDQSPAPAILLGDSESRRKDDEVACGLFQELELLKGKIQNHTLSLLVEEPERRRGEIAKSSAPVEKFQDVFDGGYQNASLVEHLNNVKHDFSIFGTFTKAETRGDISSSCTSLTNCETGGRRTEATLSFSAIPHPDMNAEDIDIVSPIEASPEMSTTGCEKLNSSRSHVVDDFSTALPPILAESVALPPSSPNHISTSEPSSNLHCDVQDVTDMLIDERLLEEAEVLEEPGKNTSTEIKIIPKGILVESLSGQDLEGPHLVLCSEKLNFGGLEPVSAVLRIEPTIAQACASSDPSMSQDCEEVFVTIKSDKTLPESEPASEGSLGTEISTVYMYISEDLNDVDCRMRLGSARQTEKSILEMVERVEAEINLVERKIAQTSFELSSDVSLEKSVSHHAGVSALDFPSKVAKGHVSIPMEEDIDTGVVCHTSCQSPPTAVSSRLGNSPICFGRDIFSTSALLLRESSMVPIPDRGVLESVPGRALLKSVRFDKVSDVKDVRGASILLSFGSEESDYSEILFDSEVAEGGSLRQKRNQTMVESLVMENKERSRLSGIPFIHLLPQNLTRTVNQQLYHSPIEAPVWQHNAETHKNNRGRLLEKIVKRRHLIRFKERVLTLRYRALKEAWKREQNGPFVKRNHPKAVSRWENEGSSDHGSPSQRSSLRLRPLSLDRLDAESDASQAMKTLITLMKDLQVEVLRPVFKMPAMILDEKERAVRRFVSKNALVEDPIAVELERKILNPWSAEERMIFAEKFAVHDKNFKEIASYLQYKTIADCVEFYYRNQKSENFGKSQHDIQLKNRWDYTKTSSTFLAPTATGIKRNHEGNCTRVEALNVTNMNMKLSESNSQLHVSEHANTFTDPFTMQSNVEMREVILPSGATIKKAMSNLMSTRSVSSTAAPVTDRCKEKEPVEMVRSGPSTVRSFHSEEHPAGLKGTRRTHLQRMSNRAAAQEQDSQWTDAERELFTSAVATFGRNFRLIASHVGTKSLSQCKAFFSKTRKRLCLDDLLEQFQANEAAVMLLQSFRHDADLAQEVKLINIPEMNASAAVIAEELIDTAAAVSTLESLKEQSKCFANEMSDLSLVADAAAVMEEIALVKPEALAVNLYSSGESMTSSQDLACELLIVNRSEFTVPSTLLREDEDEDSEATKSDGSYQIRTEAETDIVVDQAAAALIGMSVMLADKSGLMRNKSEAKVDTKSFSVSVSSRSQSARLPISCPSSNAVRKANLCPTSRRTARHTKQRVNATNPCKAITRDRPQDIQDAHAGKKSREMAGGEPKPRREPTSWTQEEKEKFAVILQEHGKDWALLHESLPSKSLTQIKTYFQNSKARSRLPTSDKLLNLFRNNGVNRKRKADEFESTRRAAELALPVKPKVRGNAAPLELDSATQKEDTLLGSASFSGTGGVGVDILASAACFGTYPRHPADQDTLSMNGVQHLVRQLVSANTCVQGSTQDGFQVFPPGARPALPSLVVTCPRTSGGFQQLSGSGPPKPVGPGLEALPPGVLPQSDPPAVVHQVAEQVQQMLQQQQHLQKQLNLLIQQQAVLPPQLLPNHQQATQQTLQAVRPLEEKLHQVVQQLQQRYELHGRDQAPSQEESHSRMDHFQHRQVTPAQGVLKVKPIRGAVSKPPVDLVALPSSGVLPNQAKSQNEDIHLKQQDHSSLGIGSIASVTAGNRAGVRENYVNPVELQDTDTDTDWKGTRIRLMVTEGSRRRMSIVHSTSCGQQQNTTQSTYSTLSSDSEQMKSGDVKLFGQSLLSKPPPLPSSVSCSAGSSTQEFLSPNTSASLAIMAFPTGTLSKRFRTSETLPSTFGRAGALSIITEAQQQPALWPGKFGAWSTLGSLQLSGMVELTREELDSENAQGVKSLSAQLDAEPQQAPKRDDEHHDSEREQCSW